MKPRSSSFGGGLVPRLDEVKHRRFISIYPSSGGARIGQHRADSRVLSEEEQLTAAANEASLAPGTYRATIQVGFNTPRLVEFTASVQSPPLKVKVS